MNAGCEIAITNEISALTGGSIHLDQLIINYLFIRCTLDAVFNFFKVPWAEAGGRKRRGGKERHRRQLRRWQNVKEKINKYLVPHRQNMYGAAAWIMVLNKPEHILANLKIRIFSGHTTTLNNNYDCNHMLTWSTVKTVEASLDVFSQWLLYVTVQAWVDIMAIGIRLVSR